MALIQRSAVRTLIPSTREKSGEYSKCKRLVSPKAASSSPGTMEFK